MQHSKSHRFSLELVILGTLALIDALTTLCLLRSGLAEEANPVAKFYVQLGPIWFLGLKMIPVAMMAFIEIRRFMDRRRMMIFMRVGLVIYASVYVSGMLAQYGRFAQPRQREQVASINANRAGGSNPVGGREFADPGQN